MTLCIITKQFWGQFRKNLDAPIKDKDRRLLISEETQDARWAEYFSEILNRPPPETEPDIPVAVEDLEIETSPPSKEEIINAIKALGNNEAPGPDNLNAELFKTDPAIAAEILLPLMMKFGKTKGYQMTETRLPLLESRRKAHLQQLAWYHSALHTW